MSKYYFPLMKLRNDNQDLWKSKPITTLSPIIHNIASWLRQ